MSLTHVDYSDLLTDVTSFELRWGSELMVGGLSEGDLVSFRADRPVSFLVHAYYGLTPGVETWVGIDARVTQERAVYGKLYHKGLRADSLGVEFRISNIVDDSCTLTVSGLAASRMAAPPPKKSGCPVCGHRGEFVRTALCCPQHGAFAGF